MVCKDYWSKQMWHVLIVITYYVIIENVKKYDG